MIMNGYSSKHQTSSEILDLKSEMCCLKSKLLQADLKRIEDINSKNLIIIKLEQTLQEEQRKRIEDMDERERKIEELEREISHTIEVQV